MDAKTREFERLSGAAFLVLTAAVLVGTVLTRHFTLLLLQGALLVGGLALFLALGLRSDRLFPASRRPLYFILQWLLFVGLHFGLPHDFLWLLAMPVVSEATGRLRWWGATAVTGAYFVSVVWLDQGLQPTWAGTVRLGLSLGVAFIFTIIFTVIAVRAITARRRSEELAAKLEEANAHLRAAAAQSAELAAARERNRIARDIHDGLGHYLTVVAVQLQAAHALLPRDPAGAVEAVARAETLTQSALDEVRRSVGALRAAAEAPPLVDGVRGLVAECGPTAALAVLGEARRLPEALEQALFRTVQEALTNGRKHAQASRLEVTLDFRDPARMRVEIADNGRGCSDPAPGGFGLRGLRERLEAIGGAATAGNRPGGGFCVRAEVPA